MQLALESSLCDAGRVDAIESLRSRMAADFHEAAQTAVAASTAGKAIMMP